MGPSTFCLTKIQAGSKLWVVNSLFVLAILVISHYHLHCGISYSCLKCVLSTVLIELFMFREILYYISAFINLETIRLLYMDLYFLFVEVNYVGGSIKSC